MTCPPADQLVRFVEGTLPGSGQHDLEDHLDRCTECRTSVAALVRGASRREHFGRYRIDGELGQGGMGIVFRAWDPQLGRAVAIKVVRHADPQHRQRLVREAQSLARLSHPNVCQIYDVGQDGDEVWFAMELVDGVTLRAYAADHAFADTLAALLGVAEGLAAAHRADIVHRDVKPDNVLVDRRGRAIVMDFGLARILATDAPGPNLTSTGLVFGSPGYMSPEQLSGTAVDARADQFAWAVSAWELLAPSRLPTDPTARIAAIVGGLAPPPELPPALGAVLVRALALDPTARFASMDEVIAALHAPPPPARRRRRVWLPVAGGASAVALVTIVAITHGGDDRDAEPVHASVAPRPPAPVPAPAPDAAAPEQLPAGYRRLAPLGPANRVDPEAEWKRAFEEARREHPDARVVKLDVEALVADGTVDLAQGGSVSTQFLSPGAYRDGAPQPGLTTSLGATGGYISLTAETGTPRTIGWPRCTTHEIWQRAARRHTLPAGAASLTYVADPWGRPTWYFQMGPVQLTLHDDC